MDKRDDNISISVIKRLPRYYRFLQSLKEKLKGFVYIEHREYIEKYRRNLEEYKRKVELREYLEEADYA